MNTNPAVALSAATTFTGTPTTGQLAPNSFVSIPNNADQPTFTAKLDTSAFVGTLTFYGLEIDGSELVPISGHLRNSSTIANNTAISTAVALNQVWVGSIAAFQAFYVVCTAFTSGSVNVQTGLSAAPYAVSISNGTALGQQVSNASLPVVLASDQTAIPTKLSAATFLDTTQTGISATYQSATLNVGQCKELLLLVNLSAFSGTSVTFKVRSLDGHSNFFTITASSALTTTSTISLAVTSPFGDQVIVEATAVSVTSMTFTAVLKGK